MLKSLAITNVALVDRAEISFSEGLNVLSGETGAGKSVILDCIDFVLGAKADRNMIRYGQSECSVRAEFSSQESAVEQLLSEFDIEADDCLVISRKLNVDGKGAIKINGCAVTATMLRRLTMLLLDVHGQSEHFFLLNESNQLSLLDKVIGKDAEDQKQLISQLLKEKKNVQDSLNLLGGDDGERSRRVDILKYQIDEIERISPKQQEDEELAAQQNLFQHGEKILEGLTAAQNALSDDESGRSGIELISFARRSVGTVERFDDKYRELTERLEEASAELLDICDQIGSYLEELDFDEEERERVEARIDEIKSLKKKYGGSIPSVLEFLTNSREELAMLESAGERREELLTQKAEIEKKLYDECQKLTEIRKNAAEEFTQKVTNELKTLNISSARFEIAFQEYDLSDVEKATHTGLDNISFLFSANAGEPLKELGKIISGGEMSRFMLAVKAVYAGNVGTCVFDEIDSGIGGRTAWSVAEKFCKIARSTQVIAVSHLAQIASFADKQFLIEKNEVDEKTVTSINEVTGEARVKEIARILSGDCSELALKQAEELLEKAKEQKLACE